MFYYYYYYLFIYLFIVIVVVVVVVVVIPLPFFLRASIMVSDAYLHVPGYHPLVNNPMFFDQRVDDPSVLPSLHQHLWGRLASLGRLTLQLEKKVHVSDKHGRKTSEDDDGGGSEVGVASEPSEESHGHSPVTISGEGSCLVLEWSKPTFAAVSKVLEHCRTVYLQPSSQSTPSPASSSSNAASSSPSLNLSSLFSKLSSASLQIYLQVADVNLFLYGMTPGERAAVVCLSLAVCKVVVFN